MRDEDEYRRNSEFKHDHVSARKSDPGCSTKKS